MAILTSWSPKIPNQFLAYEFTSMRKNRGLGGIMAPDGMSQEHQGI